MSTHDKWDEALKLVELISKLAGDIRDDWSDPRASLRDIQDCCDGLRKMLTVPSAVRPFDKTAADRMAAAVDVMVRRNVLDPRSLVADARLDYGQPFANPEEILEDPRAIAISAIQDKT